MTTFKNIVFGCVSDHGTDPIKVARAPIDKPLPLQRVRFGLPLEEAFKENILPVQLMDMLVFIARDGITTADLFRRPGNPNDLKQIVKKLSDGRDIDYTNYNFYTLASVIKKFLLKIPGGVFGPEAENELLNVLKIHDHGSQFDSINRIIKKLPKVSQELTSMLFGTWFRMSHHSEYNCMSSESVAKSVAGSLFHTCSDDPHMVNLASQVLQILIDNFAASNVFGRENIDFFTQATRTKIDVVEKYKYELDANLFDLFGDMSCEEKNGVISVNKAEATSIEECLALFEKVVAHDARTKGIDPLANAISPSKFFENGIYPKAAYHISKCSNQPNENIHKGITQECTSLSSYLSAPDVYEVMDQHHVSNSEMLTKSLSRVESVYRKQLMRLRLRNNWFLNCIPTSTCSSSKFSNSIIDPDRCFLNSDTSCLSSSFSCGLLSNHVLQEKSKAESAISNKNDYFQLKKISLCQAEAPYNDPTLTSTIPNANANGGSFSSCHVVPYPQSIELSKQTSTVPDFSVHQVDVSRSSIALLSHPEKIECQPIANHMSIFTSQTGTLKNKPTEKYFQVQYCYGDAHSEHGHEDEAFRNMT